MAHGKAVCSAAWLVLGATTKTIPKQAEPTRYLPVGIGKSEISGSRIDWIIATTSSWISVDPDKSIDCSNVGTSTKSLWSAVNDKNAALIVGCNEIRVVLTLPFSI